MQKGRELPSERTLRRGSVDEAKTPAASSTTSHQSLMVPLATSDFRTATFVLVVQAGPKGSKDPLESVDSTAEIETLLSTLEERFLDLRVALARPLSHQVFPGSFRLSRSTVQLASPRSPLGA